MDQQTLDDINTIPQAVFFINPQNASEVEKSFEEEIISKHGMERINGVLVPAEIARKKTQEVSKVQCKLCKQRGSTRRSKSREGLLQVTMCEVRQHNTLEDCWITCKGYVYDATAFMKEDEHPGGERAFLRRAGGIVDCAQDFAFHSARGRRLWAKYRIGVVLRCDEAGYDSTSGRCIVS